MDNKTHSSATARQTVLSLRNFPLNLS